MLKTWDIFDTLIARRCVAPHLIFQIIEQKFNIGGFAQARIMAEKNLNSRVPNYKLDDIYDEFFKITNAPQNLCDELKNFECQTEIEQAIPITENILQVRSGDILISDMYLPEEIIRKMLLKCGLIVPVEIVITSNGKSSGRIWKQVAAQNEFVFHIGDNEISDIKNPRDAGFDSSFTTLSRPNIAENYLMQKDFEFAAYLREIHLKNPYQEEIKRKYWEFFTLNIGILIILVQMIDDLQKKCGFEYLGFCGRDTYYMWLLYKKFKEDKNEPPIPSDYLYYSRKLIHNSKDETLKYFSAKINGRKALMIDLTGTGTHLYNLKLNSNLKYSILICSTSLNGKKYYPRATVPENWINFFQFPDSNIEDFSNFYFLNSLGDLPEFFNRATHNSPIAMKTLKIGENIVPKVIFNEVNDTENFDVFKNCLQEILRNPIKWGGAKGSIVRENLIQLMNIFYHIVTPLANNFKTRHVLNENVDSFTTFKNYK